MPRPTATCRCRATPRTASPRYAAAEAGLNFYCYHLNQDNDYWTKCDAVPAPNTTELNPVNQAWTGAGADPRRWRNVPGSTAQYTVELLPAAGYTTCIAGDQKSLVDLTTGTFRLRFTGRPSPTSKLRRSVVATFRRDGFLNFLYFTDFEDLDPQAYDDLEPPHHRPDQLRRPLPRGAPRASATRSSSSPGTRSTARSTPTTTSSSAARPCSGATRPTASRSPAPSRAGSSPAPAAAAPRASRARSRPASRSCILPTTNGELQAASADGIVYTGNTHIRLNSANTMDVSTWNAVTKKWVTTTGAALPTNGVVYVKDGTGGCTVPNPPLIADYDAEPNSCGTLYLTGTYAVEPDLRRRQGHHHRPPDRQLASQPDPQAPPATAWSA